MAAAWPISAAIALLAERSQEVFNRPEGRTAAWLLCEGLIARIERRQRSAFDPRQRFRNRARLRLHTGSLLLGEPRICRTLRSLFCSLSPLRISGFVGRPLPRRVLRSRPFLGFGFLARRLFSLAAHFLFGLHAQCLVGALYLIRQTFTFSLHGSVVARLPSETLPFQKHGLHSLNARLFTLERTLGQKLSEWLRVEMPPRLTANRPRDGKPYGGFRSDQAFFTWIVYNGACRLERPVIEIGADLCRQRGRRIFE